MELNIGTNIKRLRLEKGLTQEQLACLLTVSAAAVSKWEAKNTYPDIAMLFPLAEIFGVSIDQLLGYDEMKTDAEIESALSEYRRLHTEGKFREADALIRRARRDYPHDYRIMSRYMWHIAGGSAGNDPATLRKHHTELTQLCECILEGCTQDNLRADAINMKAKLLHAEGRTDEALQLLSRLPAWHAPVMKEQLFGKETAEFRYWNKRNCYGLMDVMAIKLARTVCFEPTLTVAEKAERAEAIAEEFGRISQKEDLALFCIGQHAVYTTLLHLLIDADVDAALLIHISQKHFAAMKAMQDLAQTDDVLRELIRTTYGTDDLVARQIDLVLNANHPQFAPLKEDPEYLQMLQAYSTKA